MPRITLLFGSLLVLLGIITYGIAAAGMTEGHASMTALIPTWVGLVLMALAIGSILKDDLRKHLMHAAAAIGLLAGGGALFRGLKGLSKPAVNTLAVSAQLLMGLLCLVFVGLCIKSFRDARMMRAKTASI